VLAAPGVDITVVIGMVSFSFGVHLANVPELTRVPKH
jgi:hypothetical protein